MKTLKVISLTSSEYSAVVKRLSESGPIGGIVYDALIAKVAQKAGVKGLLTFNRDHFKRVWPAGENVIVTP
jgi:predicted nucleic acid-binding protein